MKSFSPSDVLDVYISRNRDQDGSSDKVARFMDQTIVIMLAEVALKYLLFVWNTLKL